MNSLNHYAYGAIAEWMYRWMCGLNPMEEAPGFAKAKLTPRPGEGLNDAKASVRTASGVYESGWERKADGSIAYRFPGAPLTARQFWSCRKALPPKWTERLFRGL